MQIVEPKAAKEASPERKVVIVENDTKKKKEKESPKKKQPKEESKPVVAAPNKNFVPYEPKEERKNDDNWMSTGQRQVVNTSKSYPILLGISIQEDPSLISGLYEVVRTGINKVQKKYNHRNLS